MNYNEIKVVFYEAFKMLLHPQVLTREASVGMLHNDIRIRVIRD